MWASQGTPKVKESCCIWPLPQPKKRLNAQCPFLNLGCIPWTYLLSELKFCQFKWDPEQEKVLQQVQAAMKDALPLGPSDDPADPMVLKLSAADMNIV